MKRTVRTTDRYDTAGNLIERTVETTDEYVSAQPEYQPNIAIPQPNIQPVIVATDGSMNVSYVPNGCAVYRQ